jgi:hypothetical protein
MKNNLFSSFSIVASGLLLAALFSFSACKKDGAGDSFFRFKVDGASFEAEGLLAYAVDFSDEVSFYGVQDQNGTQSCYINVPADSKPGTYALGAGDYDAYYIDGADASFSTNWGPSEGTVTIEEIDAKHARGTFQFTAYDSATESVKKTITDGKFDVEFR